MDNRLVVPVDTTVKVLITGADVIHSWAVPAFGVKKDGVPGRLNETWFKATKIGTFYGQCSQLCGVGHGFMPIVVDVVSKEDFNAWVQKKKPAEAAAPVAPASDTAAKNAADKNAEKPKADATGNTVQKPTTPPVTEQKKSPPEEEEKE